MLAATLKQKLDPSDGDRGGGHYYSAGLESAPRSVPTETFTAAARGDSGRQNIANDDKEANNLDDIADPRLVHLTAASLIGDSVLNPMQCGHYFASRLLQVHDTRQQSFQDKRRDYWPADKGHSRLEIFPPLYEDISSGVGGDHATIRRAPLDTKQHRQQQQRGFDDTTRSRVGWRQARRRELVLLRWPIESQDSLTSAASRPRLEGGMTGAVSYLTSGQCACPLMSLDALRQLKLNSLQARSSRPPSTIGLSLSQKAATASASMRRPSGDSPLLASGASQLRESGCKLTRSKLIKRLDLRRKLRNRSRRKEEGEDVPPPPPLLTSHEFDLARGAKLIHRQAGAYSLSYCLYKLEHLSDEANGALVASLNQFARADLNRLVSILGRLGQIDPRTEAEMDDDLDDDNDKRLPIHGLPIGARAAERWPYVTGGIGSLGASSDLDSDSALSPYDSNDSGVVSVTTKATAGSKRTATSTCERPTADGDVKSRQINRVANRLKLFEKLDEHFRYRSSGQFKQIIAYSCKLFQELLGSSALVNFELMNGGDLGGHSEAVNCSTLHQLKLFACVECQKLRAILRFDWLAKCLWFAFDSYREDEEGAPRQKQQQEQHQLVGCRSKKQQARRLPLIVGLDSGKYLDEQIERDYLDALARLMGHLLRQHFLEPALDQWLGAIKRLLDGRQVPSAGLCHAGLQPNLSVLVDLVEQVDPASGVSRLHTSRPSQLVKETLECVIDELASICCNLPRLECQIGPSSCEPAVTAGKQAPRQCLITVLPSGDDLLLAKKRALNALIDQAKPTSSGGKARVMPSSGTTKSIVVEDNWIDVEYMQLIDVLNKFRSNDLDAVPEIGSISVASSLLGHDSVQGAQMSAQADELVATCKQVKLLDQLEFRLCCQLGRNFNFGALIRLDLEPLIAKVAKIIHKERLLLIRVHSDDLLKLMESLRLQLDELEVNIDLESALEDYLNKRWQIKQCQQPDLGQALLLDDNDDNAAGLDLLGGGGGVSQQQQPDETKGEDDQSKVAASTVSLKQADELSSDRLVSDTGISLIEAGSGPQACTLMNLSSRSYHAGDGHEATKSELGAKEEEEEEDDDDDDFVNALVSNNNPNVAHLFALSNPNGTPLGELMSSGELGVGGRGIAPLVECRLLLARYDYLAAFLCNELNQFTDDARFVLTASLVFLTEYLPASSWSSTSTGQYKHDGQQSMEASQLDLIGELAIRTKEFSLMLADSVQRLNKARAKLHQSTRLRSNVLNRICIEFDWLMQQLCSKRLNALQDDTATTSGRQVTRENIKHMDLVQDTASWALKLARRLEFLECQNDLLKREAKLLFCCDQYQFEPLISQLTNTGHINSINVETILMGSSFNRRHHFKSNDECDTVVLSRDKLLEFELRAKILDKWRPLIRLASKFWLLVEQFETQQVKWLNSDSKKLDYEQIERAFSENYSSKLDELHKELDSLLSLALPNGGKSDNNPSPNPSQLDGGTDEPLPSSLLEDKLAILRQNLHDARLTFDEFSQKLLPIFRFLTNKHLTQEHWIRLSQLTCKQPQQQQSMLVPNEQQQHHHHQVYTTVAQLLELNVQQFVGQLDEMSHQATIEHELSSLIEAETNLTGRGHMSLVSQLKSLEVCSRLDEWSDKELMLAASRFIKLKAFSATGAEPGPQLTADRIGQLARQLVTCHVTVRRYLKLRANLNLLTTSGKIRIGAQQAPTRSPRETGEDAKSEQNKTAGPIVVVLRSNTLLSTSEQVRASLLVEYLRLFTQTWLESSAKLATRLARVRSRLASTRLHLAEIDELLDKVRQLNEIDLQVASCDSEQSLSKLQQDCIQLELQREILATREAQTLDRQREALKLSDTCIRQLSERAIPAIRAATKALDCLGDGRSLRALRSYRPRPPLAIRLVIEAVCLLRNACYLNAASNNNCNDNSSNSDRIRNSDTKANKGSFQTLRPGVGGRQVAVGANRLFTTSGCYSISPERRFDPVRGQIMEDYWPIAWRTLNGLHSSKFIQDLRQLNRRTIPRQTIYLIRRKYLSRAEFNVASIERISHETSLLARWLIAVDVFDRVINIVKPSYEQYVMSEATCSELSADVAHKRQQINSIGRQLEHMNELIHRQVHKRATLVDLIDDCASKSRQLGATKLELERKRRELEETGDKLEASMQRLDRKCLWRTTQLVYLQALPPEESGPIERILRRLINSSSDHY